MVMRKILIISTGGTISQSHTEKGIAVSNEKSFSGDTFANVLNNLKEELNIDVIDSKTILNKDSSNIIPEDWKKIIDIIIEEYDNYMAFIVTHGTNTMGYSCAAVSYAIGNVGKPIVFTGSQVSYGMIGTDAVMNLENAIRIIADDECELAGVCCVFGSKVITGTRVKKKTEFDYDAFKTFGKLPDLANIGNRIVYNKEALEKHLSFMGRKSKMKSELIVKNKFDTNIISLTEFPGLKVSHFKALVENGIKGFILRATGAGDPNIAKADENYENLREAFEYLQRKQIPIVVTTQAPDGVASMRINEPRTISIGIGSNTCLGYEYGKYGYKIVLVNR